MNKLSIVFLSVIFSVIIASAQTSISGVVSSRSGVVIDGVTVSLISDSGEIASAVSNIDGTYKIADIPSGTYTLEANADGWMLGQKQGIMVSEGTAGRIDFALIRDFPPLRITVTAGRYEETARYSASSVGSVDRDELDNAPIRTFDEAIESVSGVVVSRSSATSTSSVSIRGSSDSFGGGAGNRVLLLLDGRPMLNADVQGANWSYIPLGVVERIEVVKGASSPLYGSTAMGGAVNVITRKREPHLNYGIKTEGGFYQKPPEWMRFTDDTAYYTTVTGDVSGPIGPLWMLGYVSRSSEGEYRQNGSMEIYNAYAKANYEWTDKVDLTLSWLFGQSNGGFSHPWVDIYHPLEVKDYELNDEYDRSWWDLDFTVKHTLSETSYIISKFYGHNNRAITNYNPDGDPDDIRPPDYKFDAQSRTGGVQVQYDRWCGDWIKNVVGIDGSMDYVDGKPYESSYGKHHAGNAGGFVMSELQIPSGFIISAGGRFDFRHDIGRAKDYQFSPRAGLVWKHYTPLTLRASYSQAFRAPSFAELYLEEIAGIYRMRHDPNMVPEKLDYYETGLNLDISDRANIDCAYFYQDWEDMISWQAKLTPNDGLFLVPLNLEKATITGFDINLFTRLVWGFSARSGYTYLIAKDLDTRSENEVMPYKPKHNVSASVEWNQFDLLLLHFDMRYRSEIEEAIIYNDDPPDDYMIFNAVAKLSLPTNIDLSFKVNNIGNMQYEEMAHFRMPGRSYGVSISLRK